MLGKEPSAMCTMPALRSSANHHPQEHFYWKEFISQVYQRCPSVLFSSVWGLLTFNQSSSLYTRKAYVTDMLLSSKIRR